MKLHFLLFRISPSNSGCDASGLGLLEICQELCRWVQGPQHSYVSQAGWLQLNCCQDISQLVVLNWLNSFAGSCSLSLLFFVQEIVGCRNQKLKDYIRLNGSNHFLLTDFLWQEFSCKCLDLFLTDLLVTGKLHSETFPSTLIFRVLFLGSQILSLKNWRIKDYIWFKLSF